MRLVADIGGTNVRLAFVQAGPKTSGPAKSYRNAQFASFEDVLSEFLNETDRAPEQLVVAMAGPVNGNTGRLTNLDWIIDGAALSDRFHDIPVRVINDLTALGYAALDLQSDQLIKVVSNPVAPSPQRQALVVGIGTGFNVSPVVSAEGHTICSAVEAGHTTLFASICAQLDSLKPGLASHFATVEALFSGRGRRKFLSLFSGETVESATPVIAKQGKPGNEVFDTALDAYAVLIGLLIAELKISYLPNDGVFLAGGVARSSLTGSRVALCAEAAMRENAFIKIAPPVWIISDDAAALSGCAAVEIGQR